MIVEKGFAKVLWSITKKRGFKVDRASHSISSSDASLSSCIQGFFSVIIIIIMWQCWFPISFGIDGKCFIVLTLYSKDNKVSCRSVCALFLFTGFYLATAALELCDEVHLYGFWPFPYTFYSNDLIRYHYFDKVKAKSGTHSMALEFWELWKMHQEGILRLHITPCDMIESQPFQAEHT